MRFEDAIRSDLLRPSGARPVGEMPEEPVNDSTKSTWGCAWKEAFRTQAIKSFPQISSPFATAFAVEALPTLDDLGGRSASDLVSIVQSNFGGTTKDVARMLRVSRQMMYHYRDGTEPSVENKRRLQSLAVLANEWAPTSPQSLRELLKSPQPGGDTLLDVLSAEDLDLTAARAILRQIVSTPDQLVRNKLANALSRNETAEQRADIVGELHAAGRPVYVGDLDRPDRLIKIEPGGSRVRGQMINRQFVPDD